MVLSTMRVHMLFFRFRVSREAYSSEEIDIAAGRGNVPITNPGGVMGQSRGRRPTIIDVAERAGVSKSTAARALAGEIDFKGKLPISLGENSARGTGMQIK